MGSAGIIRGGDVDRDCRSRAVVGVAIGGGDAQGTGAGGSARVRAVVGVNIGVEVGGGGQGGRVGRRLGVPARPARVPPSATRASIPMRTVRLSTTWAATIPRRVLPAAKSVRAAWLLSSRKCRSRIRASKGPAPLLIGHRHHRGTRQVEGACYVKLGRPLVRDRDADAIIQRIPGGVELGLEEVGQEVRLVSQVSIQLPLTAVPQWTCRSGYSG